MTATEAKEETRLEQQRQEFRDNAGVPRHTFPKIRRNHSWQSRRRLRISQGRKE